MKRRLMFQIMVKSKSEYVMFEYSPLPDITVFELAKIVPILTEVNPGHHWYSEQGKDVKRHFKRTVSWKI